MAPLKEATMTQMQHWTLPGADEQTIYGTTHHPEGDSIGVLLICHGFKGYKDYGFLPHVAEAAAKRGLMAHRFNFSHSGMTDNVEVFESPDLFEKDTWSKQMADLRRVNEAIANGELPGTGLARIWFGHSRGGVTVLLTGREVFADSNAAPLRPAALVLAATPHGACNLEEEEKARLRETGRLEVPSSRTGQILAVGRPWLEEIEREPDRFDPVKAAREMPCPMLVLHGQQDPTVPVEAAQHLTDAAGARADLALIDEASHTFNCPNPMPLDQATPEATEQMIERAVTFAADRCRAG